MKKMNEKLFKNYEKNGFIKIREKNISFEKEKKLIKNVKGKMSRRTSKKINYFHFLVN